MTPQSIINDIADHGGDWMNEPMTDERLDFLRRGIWRRDGGGEIASKVISECVAEIDRARAECRELREKLAAWEDWRCPGCGADRELTTTEEP